MTRTAAVLAVAAALIATPGAAGTENTSKIGASVRMGDHWYGPELSEKDLHGRVVLYEVWGLN